MSDTLMDRIAQMERRRASARAATIRVGKRKAVAPVYAPTREKHLEASKRGALAMQKVRGVGAYAEGR
jgi:hypothetical protein